MTFTFKESLSSWVWPKSLLMNAIYLKQKVNKNSISLWTSNERINLYDHKLFLGKSIRCRKLRAFWFESWKRNYLKTNESSVDQSEAQKVLGGDGRRKVEVDLTYNRPNQLIVQREQIHRNLKFHQNCFSLSWVKRGVQSEKHQRGQVTSKWERV